MSADGAAAWVYKGIWAVLVRLFRVPPQPPVLPGTRADSFRPAPGWLRYMKFWFWIVLTLTDLVFIGAWVAIWIASPMAGALITPVALFVIIAPDIVAYIAIHLRYDTMWYVLSDRSLRIRRGIMTIHEVTITYENIQNVTVRNGPFQRFFGIADVMVETAGGGGGGAHAGKGGGGHRGLIEGVADAERIRDLILARLKRSKTTGLGDERAPASAGWTAEHLVVLGEIRDLAGRLAGAR